jgi:hypothetical protein
MNGVGLELVIGHAISLVNPDALVSIHTEREGDPEIFIQAVKGFGIIGPMRARGGGPLHMWCSYLSFKRTTVLSFSTTIILRTN